MLGKATFNQTWPSICGFRVWAKKPFYLTLSYFTVQNNFGLVRSGTWTFSSLYFNTFLATFWFTKAWNFTIGELVYGTEGGSLMVISYLPLEDKLWYFFLVIIISPFYNFFWSNDNLFKMYMFDNYKFFLQLQQWTMKMFYNDYIFYIFFFQWSFLFSSRRNHQVCVTCPLTASLTNHSENFKKSFQFEQNHFSHRIFQIVFVHILCTHCI